MILDFIRSLIGDFVIMTFGTVGVIAFGVMIYLFICVEVERRRENKRLANGELSDIELAIIRSWSRM